MKFTKILSAREYHITLDRHRTFDIFVHSLRPLPGILMFCLNCLISQNINVAEFPGVLMLCINVLFSKCYIFVAVKSSMKSEVAKDPI